MSSNSVKSRNFSRLDILRSLNSPFTIDQYSTLNEVFAMGNVAPPETGYPVIKYLAIGRGGHKNVIGTGNNTLVDILQHGVTDAALFDQIPFLLVPTTADITSTERAKYRLRTMETYVGINYFAYYLKVIDTSTVLPTEQVITLNNGVITNDVAYVPSISSLTPTPVDISNTVINVVQGMHLVVQAVLPITLSSADIDNIIAACITKFGDIRYAVISELGIVGGFDKTITSTLGGISATYAEIQAAQIMVFIGSLQSLEQKPTSVTFNYALSSSSPLPPTAI